MKNVKLMRNKSLKNIKKTLSADWVMSYTAMLWFLAYARYQDNVKYSSTRLLDAILNAHRASDML